MRQCVPVACIYIYIRVALLRYCGISIASIIAILFIYTRVYLPARRVLFSLEKHARWTPIQRFDFLRQNFLIRLENKRFINSVILGSGSSVLFLFLFFFFSFHGLRCQVESFPRGRWTRRRRSMNADDVANGTFLVEDNYYPIKWVER